MFHDNLISLRKLHHMSQEELAERIGVSRQTISKYETGEALPDIQKSKELSEIFHVSLDELVNYQKTIEGLEVPPKGKHMYGAVTVGEKGQIVIPAKARKQFGLEAGERLLVLGDEAQGLALVKEEEFLKMIELARRPV